MKYRVPRFLAIIKHENTTDTYSIYPINEYITEDSWVETNKELTQFHKDIYKKIDRTFEEAVSYAGKKGYKIIAKIQNSWLLEYQNG
jgi:hypothetical protein